MSIAMVYADIYVQPLIDREEEAWRVWIIDMFGAIKGVLGAFEWDYNE